MGGSERPEWFFVIKLNRHYQVHSKIRMGIRCPRSVTDRTISMNTERSGGGMDLACSYLRNKLAWSLNRSSARTRKYPPASQRTCSQQDNHSTLKSQLVQTNYRSQFTSLCVPCILTFSNISSSVVELCCEMDSVSTFF